MRVAPSELEDLTLDQIYSAFLFAQEGGGLLG